MVKSNHSQDAARGITTFSDTPSERRITERRITERRITER
jgi:hypothetical protein